MHAQIFTYMVDLESKSEYIAKFVDPFAEALAKVDGLISKVWMADFDKKYASFYLWETEESMVQFMSSTIIEEVGNLPFLKELKISDYPVVDEASKITRGIS